jgi:enoyl-CoA hydratase
MEQTFRIDRDNTTLTLTLIRAHCLDIAGKQQLANALGEIGGDENARALILTSSHPAGMLVNVAELVNMSPADARAFSQSGHRLADALAALPMPVIAAVDGPALGGGCELVLSCDLAIAGSKAVLGQIEANGGVIPGFGGTWRLARRVGFQRACEMIFTGSILDATTAAAYGLVLESVSSADLMRRCRDLAAAAESPDAKAGRAELDKWGTADGAVYQVAAVHGPSSDAAVAPGLRSESLSDEVAKRWAALGFTTRNVSVNGVVLHVAEAGRGPLLILLHGYPQSGEIWRLIAADLATNHHVVIPDLRGMGLSEAAVDGYALSNVAEDVHQLTRSMGYNSVKVVGHDWGASVAAVYALRYRGEVTKLGFIESALPGGGFENLWTFAKPNDGFTFIPFLLMGGAEADGDTTANLLRGRGNLSSSPVA